MQRQSHQTKRQSRDCESGLCLGVIIHPRTPLPSISISALHRPNVTSARPSFHTLASARTSYIIGLSIAPYHCSTRCPAFCPGSSVLLPVHPITPSTNFTHIPNTLDSVANPPRLLLSSFLPPKRRKRIFPVAPPQLVTRHILSIPLLPSLTSTDQEAYSSRGSPTLRRASIKVISVFRLERKTSLRPWLYRLRD